MDIIEKALQKPEELRYQHAAELRGDLEKLRRGYESGRLDVVPRIGATIADSSASVSATQPQTSRETAPSWRSAWRRPMVWTVLFAGAVLAGFFARTGKSAKLTEKDTVVLADFENKTQDPVFDDTL